MINLDQERVLSTSKAVVQLARPRFLLTTIQVDGVARYRLPILTAMRDRGWEVHAAAPDPRVLAELQGHGIHTHLLSVSRGNTNPFREYRTLRNFAQVISEVQPDLSHHFSTKAVIFGCLPNIGLNVATVTGIGYSLSGPGSSFKHLPVQMLAKHMYKAALRRCNRVIFQNKHDEQVFIRKGISNVDQSEVIPGSGIDMAYFHPGKRRPHGDVVRFVLLARMLISKGIQEFAEAAAIVSEKSCKKCEFLLVGPLDSENPSCVKKEQIKEWERSGYVRWMGPVVDAVDAYAEADVAVLPSYYNEGLSRSLVEASAMALPVITTRNPGCSDVVEDGCSGLVVPIKDAKALAEAMVRMAEDDKARHTMGLRGRYFVENHFSLETVLQQVLRTYEDVLTRGGKVGVA